MYEKIKQLVDSAPHIVVVQADNPDADSLGSALALEQMLGEMGKQVSLYCGVDIPTYLRYMRGWDRISNTVPKQFDLSVIVDASTYTLFEQLQKTNQLTHLQSRPAVVIDHHTVVDKTLDFALLSLIDESAAATGEILFHLAIESGWTLDRVSAENLMHTILGDTQGLLNDKTTAETYRIMAHLTDLGAHRPTLEELRREYMRMPEAIFRYKAELIKRVEFAAEGRIAHVLIPQHEINEYSPLYNPAVLVQYDSLQVAGVALSVVFKTYDDGKITGKLRSSIHAPIAGQLAEHFGGGGHPHSAGFKIKDGRQFGEVKAECLAFATQLLDKLPKKDEDTQLYETL